MVHKIPVIAKTKKAHTTTYAPLEDIVEVVRPILSAHGFSISFRTIQPDLDQMTVVCELRHRAGHSTNNSITLPVKKVNNGMNDMQAVGAAMSYGKRYALCAMLNIATADDNNGFAVNAKNLNEDNRPTLTDTQVNSAIKKIIEKKYSLEKILSDYNATPEQVAYIKLKLEQNESTLEAVNHE
jgi:hypothetical protein